MGRDWAVEGTDRGQGAGPEPGRGGEGAGQARAGAAGAARPGLSEKCASAGDGSRGAAGGAAGSAGAWDRRPRKGCGAGRHVLGTDQRGARPGARTPAAGAAEAVPARGGGAAAGPD